MPTRSKYQNLSQKGFTLLLSALIASIVIALGTAIFQLAQKEVTLSSIGRDSQFAFYAADTGAECALYWDVRYQSFPTTTPTAADITCDNEDETTTVSALGDTVTSAFQFEPNGYCVNVTVAKTFNSGTGALSTVVHADGYNTSCLLVETSPRALQRSVELRY